ncbi:hypothetical protein CBS101457_002952 [Exobasidium rhododendri]|nr:hypothetical protein CBS101457_002952 [Exobasidium rhododendri]
MGTSFQLSSSAFGAGLLLVFLIVYIAYPAKRAIKSLPLPPGPPKLPIIGNLHQAPSLNPWRVYDEWSKKYGPVMALQYGKDTLIVLSTQQAGRDLLDKKSNIYSSRPHLVMGENVSQGMRTLLMPYGDRWKRHMKLQRTYLGPTASKGYHRLQELESLQLMLDMSKHTEDAVSQFHRYSSSLIFALGYGKRLPRGDEKEVAAVDQVMENFLLAARVGTWVIDAIPILNSLPTLVNPWKRWGNRCHKHESDLYRNSYRDALSRPGYNWSKAAQTTAKDDKEMTELDLAYNVGILYEAGSDTTTMALEVFTMAVVCNPEVMKRAQKEIDEVVGRQRIPTFEDQDHLPYVQALIKEVLRWRPVTAGGIPHLVTEDDEYNGYFIPKGSIIIPNHWAMHRDPVLFPEPDRFNPERWLSDPDLKHNAFGFGRRQCAGQHIAKNSLFINVSRLLWSFDFSHAVATNGSPIPIDTLAFTQGFNSRPQPFAYKIRIRDGARANLLESIWQDTEKDITVLLNKEAVVAA